MLSLAPPLPYTHTPSHLPQAGGFVRDNRINGALNVSRTIGDLDFKRNADLGHHEQMVGGDWVGTACWTGMASWLPDGPPPFLLYEASPVPTTPPRLPHTCHLCVT